MRNLLFAGLLVLAACTQEERQAAVNDAGRYSGAKVQADGTYKPGDVAAEVGKDVATTAMEGPIAVGSYVGGLLTVIIYGYIQRKREAKAAKAVVK